MTKKILFFLQAAILQQTAEYIYQLEQEKTRLLSQNSQLKRLYSLSQQGLTSPSSGGGSSGSTNLSDQDATSPRLKKKRMNPTNVSLENTADLMKSSSGGEADSGASTVSELSIQLHNEQRLRQRLEERLKTLEQAAAAQASNITTVNAPPVAPQQQTQPPSVAAPTPSGPPANLLPTQPLKMEVVAAAAVAEKQQQQQTTTTVVKTQPPTISARPPPGTILLADKNGMQVKVEAVHGLPTIPVTMSSSEVSVALKAEELKQTPSSVTTVSALPQTQQGGQQGGTTRSFIVTTGNPSAAGVTASAASLPAASNSKQNLDSIVEAIRHLEGDHLFSDDSHKVRAQCRNFRIFLFMKSLLFLFCNKPSMLKYQFQFKT